MAIDTASVAYTENLKKLRRFLQGRGVNLRNTIVASDAVYAADRVVVPGLHDDDAIISVLNLTDLVDATGYLDIEGDRATVTVFTVNKGIVFTAVQPGPDGNKINVQARAALGNSLPLSVQIGPRDSILGTTGHAGETLIMVNLATDSGGSALTDGSNDAILVKAAIEDAQGHPAQERIVDMELTGDGSTDWTAQAIVPLTGGASFKMGPSKASLITALSPYEDADVRYVAREGGDQGNDITVAYAAGGALAVGVITKAITVTYVVGVTTAQQVMDAVNADADASALVIASLAPGQTGAGVVETMAATNLTGGVDPGIRLSVASNAKKLGVMFATKDELDVMP